MNLAQILSIARTRRQLPAPHLRRLIRRRSGVTQQEMALLLGVSRPSVTRWETGSRTPRGEVLGRYVELLEILAEEADRAPAPFR